MINRSPCRLLSAFRRGAATVMMMIASAVCSVASAAQVDVTWTIADKANRWLYSDPTYWSPQVVPNNGNNGNTYRITVGSEGLPTLDIDAAVDSLTLKNTGQLEVVAGSTFTAAASGLDLDSIIGVRADAGTTTKADLGTLSNYDPVTNTLTGGVYFVTGAPSNISYPAGDSTLIFKGARIVTNAADLQVSGGGKITDEFGSDALGPLAINNGTFVLGHSFQTAGDFTNNGVLFLYPPSDQASLSFVVSGDLTNNGTVTLYPPSDGTTRPFVVSGGFTNNGVLTLFPLSDEARRSFVVSGDFTNFDAEARTLNGGTYIFNPDNNSGNFDFEFPGADIVTNSANLTLRASSGFIDENGQDGLRHLANNTASGSLKFESDFSMNAAHFTNAGYLFTYSALTLPPKGIFEQTGGELSVYMFGGFNGFGELNTQGGSILLKGGRVTGGGRLVGTTSSNAIISPGDGNVTPYMIFDGNMTLGPSSVMQFDLAGTARGPGAPSHSPGSFPPRVYGYDAIDCTGAITLDGELKATLSSATGNGARFSPASTDTFIVVKAQAPIAGSFKNVANGQRLQTTDGGGSFVVNYGSTTAFDPNAVVLSQFEANTGPALFLNISTRGQVGPGQRAMIGGFIITGTGPKQVIIRAIGPSLRSLTLTNVLEDPILSLHNNAGDTMMSNDDWHQSDQWAAIQDTGLSPSNPREPAIIATLEPGAYTAVVEGKNGATGVGLVEVYDLDAGAASQLANISTRGYVGTGDDVLIGGIIVGGGSGSTDVLVRALGPSLANAGVTGFTDNPSLVLYTANGGVVGSNDDWMMNDPAAVEATGLAPTNDRESALRSTLQPGAYTAVVTGLYNTPGGTGIGLVEFYRLK